MTKQPPRINAPGALGIYDGQDREFFAFDGDGNCIGTLDTLIEAARKIPRRREATS